MKNLKTKTADRAGISTRYLEYLLKCEKDPSTRVAIRLERATRIPRTIWAFGSKREKNSEWKKFVNSQLEDNNGSD